MTNDNSNSSAFSIGYWIRYLKYKLALQDLDGDYILDNDGDYIITTEEI